MGVDYDNQEVLDRKMQYLKSGDMDERFITIEIPEEMEADNQQFISIDEFIQYLKGVKITNLQNVQSQHIMSVKEAREFLLEKY